MRLIRIELSLTLAVFIAGCGGTAGTTDSTTADTTATSVDSSPTTTPTTTVETPSTTLSPGTTGSPEAVSLDDLPAECIDPVKKFVIDIEPVVSVFDYEAGTLYDFEDMTIGLLPIATALYNQLQGTECLGTTGPIEGDAYPALIEFARQEAPGSVTWLEVQDEIQGLPSGETCSEYIESVQAFVDRGGTVFDLSRAERFLVYNQFGAVNAWCGLQTAGEYTNRPEVLAFMVLDPA